MHRTLRYSLEAVVSTTIYNLTIGNNGFGTRSLWLIKLRDRLSLSWDQHILENSQQFSVVLISPVEFIHARMIRVETMFLFHNVVVRC